MSVMTAIAGILASIVPSTNSDDNGITGGAAVRAAVNEVDSIAQREFTATLGEPQIESSGGMFFADPKITIPVLDVPFGTTQDLVFDVPNGREDPHNDFLYLLDLLDLTLDEVEDIAGEEIPVVFVRGNLTVLWDTLSETDLPDEIVTEDELIDNESDDGAESKDVFEEKRDQDIFLAEDDENDEDDDQEIDGDVLVEEEVVTPASSDDNTEEADDE